MMLIKLKLTLNMTIAPNTINQLRSIGMKPSRVCFRLKWNDTNSTISTKNSSTAIAVH